MRKSQKFILFLVTIIFASCQHSEPPKPFGVIPSEAQLNWHEMEYFSLVCYGLNSYTEEEWAYGDVDPALFNPSDLNTDQWAQTASEAGMKGLILVSKHHDGFCLWPSKFTDYSVKATPWKNGEGDVLGDLSKSCKKYGLKLGVYLSPWDRNHAQYGQPEYVDYYYKQLEELLTEYGEVFEFWIDGANGGTGYYGGANERRSIDSKTYYGFDSIFSIVKKHQPNAVIFSDVGPGARWVGNENGIGGKTNWNTIDTEGKSPGESGGEYGKKLGSGEKGAPDWIPAEVNTTLLWPKAWYYHTGHQPRSLSNLMDLYYTSIGRGSPLNLGIAIAPTGQISEVDKRALLKFGEQVKREFETNLVENAKISASDYRGNSKIFSPENCIDTNSLTYWATNDSVKTAILEIDFQKKINFNRLLLQENISLGQRIHEFTLEIEENGEFKEVCKGTTVGYKRILRFDNVKTAKGRLTLKTDAPCLTLSNIGIYTAPVLVADPISKIDLKGNLSFNTEKNISTFYAVGETPDSADFVKYINPVQIPAGGKIHYFALDEKSDFKTDIIITEYGIARDNWTVVSVNGRKTKETKSSIDNNPKSFFITSGNSSKHPHEIVIDMGGLQEISAFSYLPRQDGEKEGIIYEYSFWGSKNGKQWKMIVEGTFSNIENNPNRRIIKFENVASAKFIKLVSKSDVSDSGFASFAEIEVYSKK